MVKIKLKIRLASLRFGGGDTVEAINLSNLAALVVAPKQSNFFRVSSLQKEQ